ncbi:hypothetical protein [Domibacillus indicus]|uniref:hypothetical protein n=1 Tax=Domibacillus indicus TaxID=1437523 RepID=UPI000617CB89|nr:hypothetical protein [Domibacillus indicus]
MPISLDRLKVPDEFVLTQEEVITAVSEYLTAQGWTVQVETQAGGHDLAASKEEWKAYIKCKGSRGKRQQEGMVYDNNQLRGNTGDQIEKLIRVQGEAESPSLFIMANPGLDRMKWIVSKLEGGLDKLDIIRIWVYPDRTIKWDFPAHLLYISRSLGIEKN